MLGTRLRPGLYSPVFFYLTLLSVGSAVTAAEPPVAPVEQAGPVLVSGKAQLPHIALQIGSHRITAEVAADESSRSRGLMFRESLALNHGMLFVFPQAAQYCFWMKDTPLPLTIAFIDTAGIIINLADMQPRSLDTHCSLAPAVYALEMEQGWFARRGIRPGTPIHGLPRPLRQPVGHIY